MNKELIAKVNAITIDDRATALEWYHKEHVSMTANIIGRFSDLDRFTAELWARRMIISSALCVQVGISAMDDMQLMGQQTWIDGIDQMIHIYDTTPEDLKQDD